MIPMRPPVTQGPEQPCRAREVLGAIPVALGSIVPCTMPTRLRVQRQQCPRGGSTDSRRLPGAKAAVHPPHVPGP